jgi:transcriptional regulator with XRE-family HTH domain
LSQRELAERLGTSQALVARWESGDVSPAFDTVMRAIRACGLDLSMRLYTYDESHDHQIDERLKMTPTERVKSMVASARNLGRVSSTGRRDIA